MAIRCQVYVCLALATVALQPARAADPWLRLRSSHFELLTDAGERHGPGLLLHLEELRRLFIARLALPEDPAGGTVRIIAFKSASEFAAYRLIEHTDAYYVGAPGRDIIVMPLTGPSDFRTASHEYAHVMANHRGLHLPLWLAEGLAEVFSTARFQSGEAIVGDVNPGRLSSLLHGTWIPLAELTSAAGGRFTTRDGGALFYAESWALTHMLMFSPAYSPRFDALLQRCQGSLAPSSLLNDVYDTPLQAVESDLREWIKKRAQPPVKTATGKVLAAVSKPEPLTAFDVHSALAELYFAAGKQTQAKAAYLRLEAERPANPEIHAALGRIALGEGHRSEARERFRRAVGSGIQDARLCYQYAHLAEDAGAPDTEVVAALERALALDPSLDDARFSLAVAHMNAGRYADAQKQFLAFRQVPERHAFAYYNGLAYIQVELGQRDDAVRSAAEARKHARTAEEAAEAGRQAWMAQSEIAVQLTADGAGQLTRIPLRAAAAANEWNPFIAPGDRMERREGALRAVDCSGKEIRLAVVVEDRTLVLSLPDPGRVQVRQSGANAFELTCGDAQDAPRVAVEYAVISDPEIAGILRGIRFLSEP